MTGTRQASDSTYTPASSLGEADANVRHGKFARHQNRLVIQDVGRMQRHPRSETLVSTLRNSDICARCDIFPRRDVR